jgi:hypothetical protein
MRGEYESILGILSPAVENAENFNNSVRYRCYIF